MNNKLRDSLVTLMVLTSTLCSTRGYGTSYELPIHTFGGINPDGITIADRYKSQVGDMAFSPDGKLLVAGVYPGNHIWLINTQNWKQQGSVFLLQNERKMVFSRDGILFAVASDKNVTLYDTKSWKIKWRREIASGDEVFFVNNTLLCLGSHQILMRKETGEVIVRPIPEFHPSETTVAISPDGKFVAAGGRGDLRVWSIQPWTRIHRFQGYWQIRLNASDASMPDFVKAVLFSPDQRILFAGSEGQLIAWNEQTWQKIPKLCISDGDFWSLDVSSDGKYFVSAEPQQLVFRSIQSGKVVYRCAKGYDLGKVIYCPHRNIVATTSEGGFLGIWKAPE